MIGHNGSLKNDGAFSTKKDGMVDEVITDELSPNIHANLSMGIPIDFRVSCSPQIYSEQYYAITNSEL